MSELDPIILQGATLGAASHFDASSETIAKPKTRLIGTYRYIQYMRGIAAISVVYFHTKVYLSDIPWTLGRSFACSGVDLFFVISGFIITTTNLKAQRTRARFLSDRVLRVMPLYWVALTASLAVFFFVPVPSSKDRVDGLYILYSYLLLPFASPGIPTGGVPFLKIAWSLVFEMYFYYVFTAFLPIRDRLLRTLSITAFICAFVVIGLLFPSNSTLLGFITSPLVIEFLFGCWTAWIVANRSVRLPPILACGITIVSLLIIVNGAGFGDGFARVLLYGAPSAVLVLVATLVELNGSSWSSRPLRTFGDASYSIYLFHPFVLSGARLISAKLHIAFGQATGAAAVASATAAAVAVGVLVHIFLEAPLLNSCRRLAKQFS